MGKFTLSSIHILVHPFVMVFFYRFWLLVSYIGVYMHLHGFEKRIFPDHSEWSSPGETDELLKVSTIGQLYLLTISSQSKGLS